MITAIERDSLCSAELRCLDAYWRAANYLSVGQIYLLDNPLLREPLKPVHIKPRLLVHWGTTPGLNLIYAHLNRLIQKYDLNVIYVAGPGHGGPGLGASHRGDPDRTEERRQRDGSGPGGRRAAADLPRPVGRRP